MLNADKIQKQTNLLTNNRFVIKQICPNAYQHSFNIIYIDNKDISLHTLEYKGFQKLCRKIYFILNHHNNNISYGGLFIGDDFSFNSIIITLHNKSQHYLMVKDVAKYIQMNGSTFYSKLQRKDILTFNGKDMPNDCKFLFEQKPYKKLSFVSVANIFYVIQSLFCSHVKYNRNKAYNFLNSLNIRYKKEMPKYIKSLFLKMNKRKKYMNIDPLKCRIEKYQINNFVFHTITAIFIDNNYKKIVHLWKVDELATFLKEPKKTVYSYFQHHGSNSSKLIINCSMLMNPKFKDFINNGRHTRIGTINTSLLLKYLINSSYNNSTKYICLRNYIIRNFTNEIRILIGRHHLQYLLNKKQTTNTGKEMNNIIKTKTHEQPIRIPIDIAKNADNKIALKHSSSTEYTRLNKRLLKLEKNHFTMADVGHEIKLALKKNDKKNINKFESQIYYLKQQIKQIKTPWYKKI